VVIQRRLVAGFVGLVLMYAAAAPAVAGCAGWSSARTDRHACCGHLGDLASEASVTDCCAAEEQSNGPADRDAQASPQTHPVAPTAAFLIDPSPALQTFAIERAPVEAASPPKYVLLGSFLI